VAILSSIQRRLPALFLNGLPAAKLCVAGKYEKSLARGDRLKRTLVAIMKYYCTTLLCLMMWLAAAPGQAQVAILKDATTPLYAEPSLHSKLIAVLAAGDTVRILQQRKGWAQLRLRNKQKGWMLVRVRKTSSGTSAASARGGEIQDLSENQLAVSGRNAGFSPAAIRTSKPPPVDGGISLSLGFFGGDFSYVGRFFYRSLRTVYLEGTFQYVAGQIASQYLMHANARFVKPLRPRFNGYATAGIGVINTVPIQSAGGKSVSNLAFNYGLGVARQLKSNNWLHAELRQFSALRKQGTANFVEFTVGLDIGIRWSKL